MIKAELIFSILFHIIQCFICIQIAGFKCITRAGHTHSCGKRCTADFRICFLVFPESLKKHRYLICHLFFIHILKKQYDLISTKPPPHMTAGNICNQISQKLQCPVSGLMAKEIIDFFQIIHIQENQTSGMILHQLGNHHFSLTAYRQTSQIVIILAVSLTSHGSHDIRKEFSGFPFQICNTISIFCFQTFFFYFHFAFFQQTQKQICDLWIKLCSSVFAKFLLDHFC